MENLKREVIEETGLVLVGVPKLISAQDILKEDKHVVRLTYVGQAAGKIKLSDEHDKYEWFSVEELKTLENLDKYIAEILGIIK
jgi:8-oxo-dGTP pyrophosphatase MutT (NUDIX family)